MGTKRKTATSGLARPRNRVEKSLSQHPQKATQISPGDLEKLISELEAQNQELREKQKEIEESRKKYVDLYDLAPIGYFVFDRKGTIVDLNLTGARLLGISRNQTVGTPFALFLTREFLRPFNRHLKQVFSSNTSAACELRMAQRYQKSTIYVRVESAALITDKSAICLSAVINITERKMAEKERIETREELFDRNAQLRRLSTHLLETQEQERSRVAGDVHDSFASQLCVVKSELQPFFGKGEDDRLNLVFNLLDGAIRDALRIQMALLPPVLSDIGLLPALNMLCREFHRTHPHIHVTKKFFPEEAKVPDSIEIPIFRIAQEALDNIATHSSADSVTISLTRKDSFIELVIQDNGDGFNVEETLLNGSKGGVSIMKERAVFSGGLFDIESVAGEGTTLRVSWPFA